MADAIKKTSWPSTVISADTRKLVGNFYHLADDASASAGPRMAMDIFAKDGVMKVAAGEYKGRDEIAKSRELAWHVIKQRHHDVLKVYTSDSEGRDLLLIGKMTAWDARGKSAEVDFVARIVIERTLEGSRIKLYEVRADQTPVVKMLSS